MVLDEVLASIANLVKNFATIFLVNIKEVNNFKIMYKLCDVCIIMFFFQNIHVMIELKRNHNNKINWALNDKEEFIVVVEIVYQRSQERMGIGYFSKRLFNKLSLLNVIPFI